MNKSGYVDGFVQFKYLNKEKKEIEILMLANAPEKNGTGIAGQMVKLLQKQSNYISLTPNDDNAEGFYKNKCGFKNVGSLYMTWRKK